MRCLLSASVLLIAGFGAAFAAPTQDYVHEPLPPGIQVVNSELEGPVFGDARGHTLYRWATNDLFKCEDVHYRETTGLFSIPYAGGVELPEADTRPTCVEQWPAAFAPPDAKPIGKWTIVARKDGKRQWAYNSHALYTSHLDRVAGETNGGHTRFARNDGFDAHSLRTRATPLPAAPPPRRSSAYFK